MKLLKKAIAIVILSPLFLLFLVVRYTPFVSRTVSWAIKQIEN